MSKSDIEKNENPEEEIVYEDEEFSGEEALNKLREKLKKCVKEKQDYLLGWQRAQADLINAKKRLEADKADFAAYANQNFIMELLPVMDSFDMAFKDKEAWEKAPETWRRGIEYIYTQLLKVLESGGVIQIKPIDETFNENEHDSVELIPVKDKKDDHKVMEVILAGYKMKNKIIRPAKVKVGSVEN